MMTPDKPPPNAREMQKRAVASRWGKRTPKERSEEMRRIALIRWRRPKRRLNPAPNKAEGKE
jgi:hypothetical protein